MFTEATRYRSVKGVRKPRPEPFTRDEMQAILAGFWRNRTEDVRNNALIIFLYRCCARIGATLRMMPGDIDWTHNIVRIYKDKGGKTRNVVFDDRAKLSLLSWRIKRDEIGIGNDKPFFCSFMPGSAGNPLREPNALKVLQKKCRQAGITRRVNLHLLRHTGASELLEEGFDVATISRVLGHSSIMTTYRYLHELRPDIVNIKLAKRMW